MDDIEKRLPSQRVLTEQTCLSDEPEGDCPHPTCLLSDTELLQQTVGMAPAVHEVQHVTHVDIDGASQLAVEEDVAGE